MSHHVAAWSVLTGKGLLYFAMGADKKAQPEGILHLAYAYDMRKEGANVFAFTVHGCRHRFRANNAVYRDCWVSAIEKCMKEAERLKSTIEATEGYPAFLPSTSRAWKSEPSTQISEQNRALPPPVSQQIRTSLTPPLPASKQAGPVTRRPSPARPSRQAEINPLPLSMLQEYLDSPNTAPTHKQDGTNPTTPSVHLQDMVPERHMSQPHPPTSPSGISLPRHNRNGIQEFCERGTNNETQSDQHQPFRSRVVPASMQASVDNTTGDTHYDIEDVPVRKKNLPDGIAGNHSINKADHDASLLRIKKSTTSGSDAVTMSTSVSGTIGVHTEFTLAGRLNTYFTAGDATRGLYTDTKIREISAILKYQTLRWSKVPRTYVVLRNIGHLDLLDQCIDVGFSDYWFPVTERNLPDILRPSVRAAFVAAQALVLTRSMDLEKGEKGQHCYFRKGEPLPFEMKGVLGSGGYGQVDRVLSVISFKEYARKRVLRNAAFRGRKKEDVKQFIAEIEILKRLKHQHVVEFVGSYTDAKYIGLIMSPIADEDLAEYLARASPAEYPELRTFFGCLATALEFLHTHNVRHKDIKPRNILVSNGNVLFADFGLSYDFTDATSSTTMSMVNGMTPRYCAPEVANHQPRNTMSDIWCLGVVFLEMIVKLKGKTTQYMDDYLRQRGSEQAFIRLNTAALPELIAHLAVLDQWADNRALEWTEPMLSVTQKSRPTASNLVAQITSSIRDGENTGFCGICCVQTEEEDFSDYASGSEE